MIDTPPTRNTSLLNTPALMLFIEGHTSIPSPTLSIIYIFCYLTCFFLIISALRVSQTIGAYHWNLKRLYWSSLFSWFAIGTSKLLVIFAQNYHFDNEHKIFNDTGNIILHVSGLLRYEFCYFFIINLFAIILERSFATFFIGNYEKQQRNWIFYLLFLSGFSISTIFAFLTVMRVITLFMLAIYVLISATSTSIGFWILEYRNSRRLLVLENGRRQINYTLSMKYQLRENINTLQSMKKLMMVALVAVICLALAYIAPALLGISSSQMWITHTFIDMLYHFNPLYMVPACLISIPQNRHLLKRVIAQKLGVGHATPQSTAEHFSNEGDVYFNMFQKSLTTNTNSPRNPQFSSLPIIARPGSGAKIHCAPVE